MCIFGNFLLLWDHRCPNKIQKANKERDGMNLTQGELYTNVQKYYTHSLNLLLFSEIKTCLLTEVSDGRVEIHA